MARYKVVRPIEYNQKLYIPATAVSAASGAQIQVDASGFIQLDDQEAAQFNLGQLEPAGDTTVDTSDTTATTSSKRTKS